MMMDSFPFLGAVIGLSATGIFLWFIISPAYRTLQALKVGGIRNSGALVIFILGVIVLLSLMPAIVHALYSVKTMPLPTTTTTPG